MAKINVSFPRTVSCIRLIKKMLDGAYAHINLPEQVKDAAINARLAQYTKEYEDLRKGSDIDYSGPIDRFAYIYRYVASHAGLVAYLIGQSDTLRELFDRDRASVAALGGGPGSEYLGIYKYLQEKQKEPRLKCSLFDREMGWGDAWYDIDEKIEPGAKIARFFIPLDVTDEASWKKHERYFDSDLFVLVYFMSEVYKHRVSSEPYFQRLFAQAKPGALFLFADNSWGGFAEWFDKLAASGGLEIVDTGAQTVKLSPYDEEKEDFGVYFKKFGWPKISANIAWRVARKK